MTAKELEKLIRSLGMSQVRLSGQNVMACCPNHSERRPSWGISVNPPHLHGCFSCGFKGGLDKLLRHFEWTQEQIENVTGAITQSGGLVFGNNGTPNAVTPVSEAELYPFTLDPVAVRYLKKRGFKFETLKNAGILYHGLDRRVLFPWWWQGKFYGMTGRAIDANPVKIEAYHLVKKGLLYAPFPKSITGEKPLILVEGELDALAVAQAGFKNVCALGRGTFGLEQWRLLESLPVNKLILFFDDDPAGWRIMDSITLWVPCQVAQVSWIKVKRKMGLSILAKEKMDPADLKPSMLRWALVNAVENLRRLALGSS